MRSGVMRSPSQSQATIAANSGVAELKIADRPGVDRQRRVGEAEEGQRRVGTPTTAIARQCAAQRRELAARREQRHEQERGAGDAQEGERDRAERRHGDAHEEERAAPEGGQGEQLGDVARPQWSSSWRAPRPLRERSASMRSSDGLAVEAAGIAGERARRCRRRDGRAR